MFPAEAGTGRVSIVIEGTGTDETGRTLFPSAPVFSKYELTFTPKGTQTAPDPVTVQGGARHSLNLPAGNWTITAVGYVHIEGISGIANGDYEAARGEQDVTVYSSSSTTIVMIDIKGGVEEGQKGVFSYDITLPVGLDSAFLQIYTLAGAQTSERSLTLPAGGPSGSFALDAGYYLLKIKQTKSGKDTIHAELVHIYGGLTTSAAGPAYDFTSFHSVAEVAYYLAGMPANTAAYPYHIVLSGLNLERDLVDHYDPLAKLMEALEGKYVELDLSGCTGSSLRDTWGYDSSTPNKDKVVSIILPDTITILSGYNFRGYTSLVNIVSEGLETIGSDVFSGCTSLVSLELPQTLTRIEADAFAGCSALEEVYLPSSLSSFSGSPFPDKADLTFHVYGSEGPTRTLETGKILICGGAIVEYNASKTGNIVIPAGITSISERLFSGAAITSVVLPETLTSIGKSAFEYCAGLTAVDYPAALNGIGEGAFRGCTSLGSVDLSHTGVTTISGSLFSGCTGLETVILPVNLTGFGNPSYDYGYQGAFQGCTALDSINLADTKLTNIGENAFNGCISLTSLVLPGTLTTIGDAAFNGCMNLTSLEVPDSITSAGIRVFAGCSSLVLHIEENDKVKTDLAGKMLIARGVLIAHVEAQGDIVVPDGVTGIAYTYRRNPDITSVIIPNTVTSIINAAFSECSSLVSVILPETLTSIGDDAFWITGNLISVVIYAVVPPTLSGDYVFQASGVINIYVPDESVETYKATNRWSDHASKIKPISELPPS
jgi:hypothetical protein